MTDPQTDTPTEDDRRPWEAPALVALDLSDETASGPFYNPTEGSTPFYSFGPS